MIDIEKQSEEYKNKLAREHYDCYLLDFAKMCFQDGIKCGMENSVEWHNLKENPNDLPKYENSMTIRICWINPYGNKCYHDAYYDGEWFYWISDKTCKKHYADCGVIAWCELPQFEEKRKCLAKKQKPRGKKMTRVIMDWNRRNDKSL